jgi:nucleotide-binding universal stress UspA family protein
MIEKILVGVDGSSYNKSLIKFSIEFSKIFKAKITFVHVVDTIQVSEISKACENLAFDPFLNFNQELRKACELELSALYKKGELLLKEAQQFAKEENVLSETILETGIIPRVLEELSCNYDMIFAGRKGINDEFVKSSIGINTDALIRHIKIPMFISPNEYYTIKNIVVAYDGKASSLRSLEVSRIIHEKCSDINLKILYVTKLNTDTNDVDLESISFGDKVILKNKQNTASAIIDYINNLENPLLIIGKSNKGEFITEIIGSVTEEILRQFPKFAILVTP